MHNYTIHFAASFPGEPGGGASDSDFQADHEHTGSLDSAIVEAKQLAYVKYRGDYRWYITYTGQSVILAEGCY